MHPGQDVYWSDDNYKKIVCSNLNPSTRSACLILSSINTAEQAGPAGQRD